MAYDLLGYDVLGDEDIEGQGDDVLGAQVAAGGLRNARWARQLRKGAPGAPAIAEMMLPLGLGSVTFTSNGPTSLVLTAAPQLAFRGERILLSGFCVEAQPVPPVGVAADPVSLKSCCDPLCFLAVADIKVGQRSQLVSAAPIPGPAFAPTAFGVRTFLDPCAPGILVSVKVDYLGPPLADGQSITVTGVILGRSAG